MDEIAIVKRRSLLWPILALLVIVIAVLVALWVMGYLGPTPEELNVLQQLSVVGYQLPELVVTF